MQEAGPPGRSWAEGKICSWMLLLSDSSSSALMGSSSASRMTCAASSAFFPITEDLTAQVYCFPKRWQICWKDWVYRRSVSERGHRF